MLAGLATCASVNTIAQSIVLKLLKSFEKVLAARVASVAGTS